MNRLAVSLFLVATFNFVLATDPPPFLRSTQAIVACLCQMMRVK